MVRLPIVGDRLCLTVMDDDIYYLGNRPGGAGPISEGNKCTNKCLGFVFLVEMFMIRVFDFKNTGSVHGLGLGFVPSDRN